MFPYSQYPVRGLLAKPSTPCYFSYLTLSREDSPPPPRPPPLRKAMRSQTFSGRSGLEIKRITRPPAVAETPKAKVQSWVGSLKRPPGPPRGPRTRSLSPPEAREGSLSPLRTIAMTKKIPSGSSLQRDTYTSAIRKQSFSTKRI